MATIIALSLLAILPFTILVVFLIIFLEQKANWGRIDIHDWIHFLYDKHPEIIQKFSKNHKVPDKRQFEKEFWKKFYIGTFIDNYQSEFQDYLNRLRHYPQTTNPQSTIESEKKYSETTKEDEEKVEYTIENKYYDGANFIQQIKRVFASMGISPKKFWWYSFPQDNRILIRLQNFQSESSGDDNIAEKIKKLFPEQGEISLNSLSFDSEYESFGFSKLSLILDGKKLKLRHFSSGICLEITTNLRSKKILLPKSSNVLLYDPNQEHRLVYNEKKNTGVGKRHLFLYEVKPRILPIIYGYSNEEKMQNPEFKDINKIKNAYSVSLPFVVCILVYNISESGNYGTSMNTYGFPYMYLYYRLEKLPHNSLENVMQSNLYSPNLPNLMEPNPLACFGIPEDQNFGHDPDILKRNQNVINYFFTSQFNNHAEKWFQNMIFLDHRLSSFHMWQEYTKKDPNFIFTVPWPLRGRVSEILDVLISI